MEIRAVHPSGHGRHFAAIAAYRRFRHTCRYGVGVFAQLPDCTGFVLHRDLCRRVSRIAATSSHFAGLLRIAECRRHPVELYGPLSCAGFGAGRFFRRDRLGGPHFGSGGAVGSRAFYRAWIYRDTLLCYSSAGFADGYPTTHKPAIAITKMTALGMVIGVPDILGQATTAQSFSANASPLTLAALAYIAIFLPLVIVSRWLETRFSQGAV